MYIYILYICGVARGGSGAVRPGRQNQAVKPESLATKNLYSPGHEKIFYPQSLKILPLLRSLERFYWSSKNFTPPGHQKNFTANLR